MRKKFNFRSPCAFSPYLSFFLFFLLTIWQKLIFFSWEHQMEEIEITSWLTLDAIKAAAKTEETVGNLQVGH